MDELLVQHVAVAMYEADHPSTPRPHFTELSEHGQRWWRYLARSGVLAARSYRAPERPGNILDALRSEMQRLSWVEGGSYLTDTIEAAIDRIEELEAAASTPLSRPLSAIDPDDIGRATTQSVEWAEQLRTITGWWWGWGHDDHVRSLLGWKYSILIRTRGFGGVA